MPDLLENSTTFKRNSLPNRQCKAARKILVRRTVYEGDALSDIAVARRTIRKALKSLNAQPDPDVTVFATWCREFDRLLERERIVLRIPLPATAKANEPRTIHRLDRDTTATVIESVPTSPSPELQAKLNATGSVQD